MGKEFEEELKHDYQKAWFGYICSFSKNCFFILRHRIKGQRRVTCKSCNAKIPKQVPRILISGSWNYKSGHYCLKCAIEKIENDISDKEDLASHLQDNLADLKALLGELRHTSQKEKYKELMALGVLISKLEPKKESY